MVLIGIAALAHIAYVWARTAGDIVKSQREQSSERPTRVRLRGWLLAFALVAWPLAPTYYAAMGELYNPEVGGHTNFAIGSALLVGAWILIVASRRPGAGRPSC
jgi:hypothetical protein